VQLGLEVVDVALGSNQLILSVLQSGTGVIEVISLEVATAISPHQLITQLPNALLQVGVLLQKLSVALLDVLDDAVLALHLIGALLQTEAQVGTRRCDLLKQGAHVLGVDESHGAPTEIPSPIGSALRTQATTILHAKYHVVGAEGGRGHNNQC
jgi:hypothetical protein